MPIDKSHLKEIREFLETKNEGIYTIRDKCWELIKQGSPEDRQFLSSIYLRLLYDTQWEKFQIQQYKYLLSLANPNAKDICIITGFPTLSLMAYTYFDDPTIEIIFKPPSTSFNRVDISSQLIHWNTWGLKVIQEDFKEFKLSPYDTILNSILPDIAFVSEADLKRYMTLHSSFDLDVKAFNMIESGQEYIWSWSFGGSRQTFPLLFDYPHPKWHNIDYLLYRWSEYFDIKNYIFKELPSNPKVMGKGSLLRNMVKHHVTDTLFVRGIKK